ncbi:hypothetical protein [Roseateles aquatilis]|nr:hypothetical protein [Roseateles aquatilis]
MTSHNRFHLAHSDAAANLRFALSRLSVDWRHLEPPALEVLLRHLLTAEHRCMPHRSVVPERPTNRWLLPRLRRRRAEVAMRLVAIGGRVSHAALARVLPRGQDWPGISALVGRHARDPVEGRQPRPRRPIEEDPAAPPRFHDAGEARAVAATSERRAA